MSWPPSEEEALALTQVSREELKEAYLYVKELRRNDPEPRIGDYDFTLSDEKEAEAQGLADRFRADPKLRKQMASEWTAKKYLREWTAPRHDQIGRALYLTSPRYSGGGR